MKNLTPYDPNNYEHVHRLRFELTFAYLKSVLPSGLLLELGGEGPFTKMLTDRGFSVVNSEGDLRYAEHEGEYDAVLCCEVMEHIHDQETDTPTEWSGSGVRHMLKAAFEVTKPGGYLLLTTPNADSLNTLNKVIHRQAPFVYRPHVREYTCHEVATAVRAAGYSIVDLRTEECWDNSMSPDWRRRLTDLLRTTQGSAGLENRGEDIFVLAKRPV